MFGGMKGREAILTTLAIIKISVTVTIMAIVHWLMRNTKMLDVAAKLPGWVVGIFWTVILLLLIWSQESSSSFIYFQV